MSTIFSHAAYHYETRRPTAVLVSFGMWLAAASVMLVGTGGQEIFLISLGHGSQPMMLAFAGLRAVLWMRIAGGMRRGRGQARTTLVLVSVLFLAFQVYATHGLPWQKLTSVAAVLVIAMPALTFALAIIASVFMYLPTANRYFEAIAGAPRMA